MANEVRLIDANAFYEQLEDIRMEYLGEDTMSSNFAAEVIETVLDSYLKDAPTIDPESLRLKGHWDIRCDYCVDAVTREADESFYLECSECKRKVWDVNQMAAMNGEYRKLIEQYPYCHCGCKMEG